jgi:molybdopterin synthase catalytic subunit
MDIRIASAVFDPQAEIVAFGAGRVDMGALASFVGLCRDRHDGRTVNELFLDQYPGYTEGEIRRICEDIARRCSCPDLLVIHRVGRIVPGEAIVLVAALTEHRENAFDTVRLLVDYLKTDAPLWKRETGPDGIRWIEPRAEDVARRARAEGPFRE